MTNTIQKYDAAQREEQPAASATLPEFSQHIPLTPATAVELL